MEISFDGTLNIDGTYAVYNDIFIKSGAGALTLSSSNTIIGGTSSGIYGSSPGAIIINGGSIVLGSTSALGSSDAAIVLDSNDPELGYATGVTEDLSDRLWVLVILHRYRQ